jgi:hypothetical protein
MPYLAIAQICIPDLKATDTTFKIVIYSTNWCTTPHHHILKREHLPFKKVAVHLFIHVTSADFE